MHAWTCSHEYAQKWTLSAINVNTYPILHFKSCEITKPMNNRYVRWKIFPYFLNAYDILLKCVNYNSKQFKIMQTLNFIWFKIVAFLFFLALSFTLLGLFLQHRLWWRCFPNNCHWSQVGKRLFYHCLDIKEGKRKTIFNFTKIARGCLSFLSSCSEQHWEVCLTKSRMLLAQSYMPFFR